MKKEELHAFETYPSRSKQAFIWCYSEGKGLGIQHCCRKCCKVLKSWERWRNPISRSTQAHAQNQRDPTTEAPLGHVIIRSKSTQVAFSLDQPTPQPGPYTRGECCDVVRVLKEKVDVLNTQWIRALAACPWEPVGIPTPPQQTPLTPAPRDPVPSGSHALRHITTWMPMTNRIHSKGGKC